jgi:hypothetical protein
MVGAWHRRAATVAGHPSSAMAWPRPDRFATGSFVLATPAPEIFVRFGCVSFEVQVGNALEDLGCRRFTATLEDLKLHLAVGYGPLSLELRLILISGAVGSEKLARSFRTEGCRGLEM